MANADNVIYKEKVVYKALEELDQRLAEKGVKPFELNVVGGFALLLEKIRLSNYTDIDYVGEDLSEDIKEIIDEVGVEFKLGRGWINNDVLLAGSSLEDLEYVVGELDFKPAFNLRVISVNSLDLSGLLRMKVVAIDTSFMGSRWGGEFTRVKDLPDIKLLCDKLGYSHQDLVNECFPYVEDSSTFLLIDYYMRFEDIEAFSAEGGIQHIIATKGKVRYQGK